MRHTDRALEQSDAPAANSMSLSATEPMMAGTALRRKGKAPLTATYGGMAIQKRPAIEEKGYVTLKKQTAATEATGAQTVVFQRRAAKTGVPVLTTFGGVRRRAAKIMGFQSSRRYLGSGAAS